MDHKKRLFTLQSQLDQKSALVIDDPLDIFYLTGLQLSLGRLIVAPKKTPFLIVDGRYFEACKKIPFLKVIPLDELALTNLLKKAVKIEKLYFLQDKTTYRQFLQLKTALKGLKTQLTPSDELILQDRAIKDPKELNLLKKAALLGSEGYNHVLTCLKEGVTEIEIANELEIFWKKKGADGLAFEPIIAFGANSSMPHYRPKNVKLKKGQTVLIDIGVLLNKYHSDMTRTVFFGEPSKKMRLVYETVQKAQAAALSICKEGVTAGELDNAAREIINEAGFEGKFNHGLGHGVGLEIHELPVLSYKKQFASGPLKENMVVTIEPGIYLPGIGGVRIEDTVIVKKNHAINLTSPSKELTIL